jgi:hypothetical protein
VKFYSSDQWQRAGRGKGLAVYAPAARLAGWVAEGIGERLSEFVLVGHESRKVGVTRHERIPWQLPGDELGAVLAEGAEGRRDRIEVHLCDPARTDLSALGPTTVGDLSLCGCPRVFWMENQVDGVRLALVDVVDRIASIDGTREVRHDEYARMFDRIKKAVHRDSVKGSGRFRSMFAGTRVAAELSS